MTPDLFKGKIYFDRNGNRWAYCKHNRGFTTTYYSHQSIAENAALRDIRDDVVTEVEVYTKAGYHKKLLGFWSIRKSYPDMAVQDAELVALVRKQDSTIKDLKLTAEAWEKVAEQLYEKANKYDKIMEAIG
jgi:hypothetical protein